MSLSILTSWYITYCYVPYQPQLLVYFIYFKKTYTIVSDKKKMKTYSLEQSKK
jgi:hypothetical protein